MGRRLRGRGRAIGARRTRCDSRAHAPPIASRLGPLASRLASEGIGTLTFDLRGHGESSGSIPADGQFAMFQQDLAAARRFVAGRPDVIPHRLGVAGASLGAALAALDAAQSSSVRSMALLSASTEYAVCGSTPP